MGRTKAFDEEAALAAAMRLFWQKGYGATSIGDLERAMALKRTSIYNTFGNKRALFQRVCASMAVRLRDAGQDHGRGR